jgi:hypothetical protein
MTNIADHAANEGNSGRVHSEKLKTTPASIAKTTNRPIARLRFRLAHTSTTKGAKKTALNVKANQKPGA